MLVAPQGVAAFIKQGSVLPARGITSRIGAVNTPPSELEHEHGAYANINKRPHLILLGLRTNNEFQMKK